MINAFGTLSFSDWQALHGRYIMANLWLWDMAGTTYTEEGGIVSRFLHLNRSWTDGCLHVQLVDATAGRIMMLKHFKDFLMMDENVVSFPSPCS